MLLNLHKEEYCVEKNLILGNGKSRQSHWRLCSRSFYRCTGKINHYNDPRHNPSRCFPYIFNVHSLQSNPFSRYLNDKNTSNTHYK